MTEQQIERNLALAAALESGEYKQTQKRLRDGDTFCCLGVACELYRKAARKGKWDTSPEFEGDAFILSGVDYVGMPPDVVRRWYGWEGYTQPYLKIGKVTLPACYWNDDWDKNFKTIGRAFRRLANDAKRSNEKAAREAAKK